MGRHARAREIFENFLSYANPHGLFSEDIEPGTGRLLGNFPQVYTHTALIGASLALRA
jgi:GH15 family glucan-1,4-alpha-glucosidase